MLQVSKVSCSFFQCYDPKWNTDKSMRMLRRPDKSTTSNNRQQKRKVKTWVHKEVNREENIVHEEATTTYSHIRGRQDDDMAWKIMLFLFIGALLRLWMK